MALKSSTAPKSGRVGLAITLTIAIAAIVMIVLAKVLHSRDSQLALYAIPVLFGGGVAAIAWQALQNKGTRDPKQGRKISNGLVVMSSAAILTIYAAGYDRTSVAADQFERQATVSHKRPSLAAAIAAKGIAEKPTADSVSRPGFAGIPADPSADRPGKPALAPAASGTVPVAGAAVSAPAVAEAPSQPSAAAAVLPLPADQPSPADDYEYADGTFSGRGSSRHGDVQVQLVIQAGQIVSASVSKCMTQYSCDVLKPVYGQLVTVQNPDKIDNVTGATDSVDAYYGGVIKALTMAANVKAFQNQYKTTK